MAVAGRWRGGAGGGVEWRSGDWIVAESWRSGGGAVLGLCFGLCLVLMGVPLSRAQIRVQCGHACVLRFQRANKLQIPLQPVHDGNPGGSTRDPLDQRSARTRLLNAFQWTVKATSPMTRETPHPPSVYTPQGLRTVPPFGRNAADYRATHRPIGAPDTPPPAK